MRLLICLIYLMYFLKMLLIGIYLYLGYNNWRGYFVFILIKIIDLVFIKEGINVFFSLNISER